MRDLLGGKGANLAEMASLGLPVPPGFTITTAVCTHYYANDQNISEGLCEKQVDAGLAHIGASPARRSATAPIRCWCRCAPARAPRCRA